MTAPDWDTAAEMAAEDHAARNALRAADNQLAVRDLLRERQPALAARLDRAVDTVDVGPHICRREIACTW